MALAPPTPWSQEGRRLSTDVEPYLHISQKNFIDHMLR